MSDNLKIYDSVRAVPPAAQKKIDGGRLKGMTDINPMWRIKTLTELFGPVGVGWWTENVKCTREPGIDGEAAIMVELDLRYLQDGENNKVSYPIHGVGGAMLIVKEKNGLRTDDEAYKKAYTDAISVACKAIGIGADVYWSADSTKYTGRDTPKPTPIICERCGHEITETTSKTGERISTEQLASYSRKSFNGGTYCAECQRQLFKSRDEHEKAKAAG